MHNLVSQRAKSFHLHLDYITGLDRTGIRRCARQQEIARLQCNVSRDIGDKIMHIPLHFFGVAILHHFSVHECANLFAMKIPVCDESRSNWTQSIGTFDSQHRPRIGVSKIM